MARQLIKSQYQIEIRSYFYNNRPLEPLSVYKKMVQDGCSAIIGFEYLSDLLLVIKEQKNERIPIFTSYASTKETEHLPKNIFIFMPSYDFLAKKMLLFLQKKFPKIVNVLLITEINRDEMCRYKEVYSKALTKMNIGFDKFDFLENDDTFEAKLSDFLRNKRYNFVFLLSGGLASSKIANLMNDHKTVFIGTENFGSSASQTFFMRLKNKEINSYFIRNIDFVSRSEEISNFENKYMKIYHTRPTVLSVYTYDAANLIFKTFMKYHSVLTRNVLKTKYSGITGAQVKNNKFYRSERNVILSVKNNGYQHEIP